MILCYTVKVPKNRPLNKDDFLMSVDQGGEVVLKKVSIFLVAFLMLFNFSLSFAFAQKNNKSSKSEKSLIVKKRECLPKKKSTQSNQFRVLATAYYKPVKGQKSYATKSFRGDLKLNGGGKSATGKNPEEGMIAVDPKVIPLGTKLYIPELNLLATAEDTGGDIKGRRIDIFTGTGEWALKKSLEIGRKMVTVVIIKRA